MYNFLLMKSLKSILSCLKEKDTFSTRVESGERFCVITRIRISFELRIKKKGVSIITA